MFRGRKHLRLAYAVALLLAISGHARAGIIAGPIENPANGHLYLLLDGPTVGWSYAGFLASEAEANALGGHLAAINDAAVRIFTLRSDSDRLTEVVDVPVARPAEGTIAEFDRVPMGGYIDRKLDREVVAGYIRTDCHQWHQYSTATLAQGTNLHTARTVLRQAR